MDIKLFFFYLTEIIYALCGIIAIFTAFRGLKNETKNKGTFLFWFIVGILFILGGHIPYKVTGGLIVLLAIITVTKNISMGKFEDVSYEFKKSMSDKFKNKIFIPALMIGILSFLLLQFKIKGVGVPSAVGLGIASVVSIIVAVLIFKPNKSDVINDTNKMVMQVGPASLLPQLLTGLGAIFTAAGVGDLIAKSMSNIIPENNILLAVIIYCLGMAIFTMIMGNGFAAFAVITTGIAAPFLLAKGANIAAVGALGMTAGFCGTLITPMAANFNIVSASIMEIKDTYKVIKVQTFLAIPLFLTHIILMYLLAF